MVGIGSTPANAQAAGVLVPPSKSGPWANFPAAPCGVSIDGEPVPQGSIQAPWGTEYPCSSAALVAENSPPGPWADAELWFSEESNRIPPYPGPFGDSVAAIESGINWERSARGVPPVTWTTADPAIVTAVQAAADSKADPILPEYVNDQHGAWSSDWASGTSSAQALDGWLYFDGPQGWNIDCPAAGDPGCGGHTRSILGVDMVAAGYSDIESGTAAVGPGGFAVALWPTAVITPASPPTTAVTNHLLPTPTSTTTVVSTPTSVPAPVAPKGWTIFWLFAIPHHQLVETTP